MNTKRKTDGLLPSRRPKSHGVYDAPAALWKRRYEDLKQFMADAEHEISKMQFEKTEERAWDPPDTIYVSFAFDVCDSEEHAIENFGEGNYDVYRLEKRSPKE